MKWTVKLPINYMIVAKSEVVDNYLVLLLVYENLKSTYLVDKLDLPFFKLYRISLS